MSLIAVVSLLRPASFEVSMKTKRKYLRCNFPCHDTRQHGANNKTSHIRLVILNKGFASVAIVTKKIDR